jgi:putative transposase
MGTVGDAYDNAMAESFFASLECELLDRRVFKSKQEARVALFTYIGYPAPAEFERRHVTIAPGRLLPLAREQTVPARA